MVEWSITAVLKTVDGNIRGFESLSLRQHKKVLYIVDIFNSKPQYIVLFLFMAHLWNESV